jgi:hypothetical protein
MTDSPLWSLFCSLTRHGFYDSQCSDPLSAVLADLPVVERAALALSFGGLAGVPHVKVCDQLPAAFEQRFSEWFFDHTF